MRFTAVIIMEIVNLVFLLVRHFLKFVIVLGRDSPGIHLCYSLILAGLGVSSNGPAGLPLLFDKPNVSLFLGALFWWISSMDILG